MRKKKKRSSTLKKFVFVLFILAILGGCFRAYSLYTKVYQPNIAFADSKQEHFVYIPTGSEFIDVITILNSSGLLINTNSFQWVAKKKNYFNNIKPGRYFIDRQMSNNELVNMLRSGKQDPVRLTFNNVRTIEDFSGKIAAQIEADSISVLNYITDSIFLSKLRLTKYNAGCLFIPNTYEFYWNTSAEQFASRMLKEYKNFWNSDRKIKAEKIGLNYYQISVLASIVEKEQNIKKDERPMISGLYLNRLNKGMKLESDPTLIFALGDFDIKRVLNKDKRVKSPYNTYKYKGLPPGPICIPSINAIDAVLNARDHNYIFMCAKEDFSGYHNFAINYTQHKRNARKYQRALDELRIMR